MTTSSPGLSNSSPATAGQLLSQKWPPLGRYWPNIQRASAPQAAFLILDTLEALYGGAAGGGKSDALLAGALQYVDEPGYAALILRRTFKQLSLPGAIMARSKEWLAPARNRGEVKWNDDEKTWRFPSGATVTFGYLETADDIYRYQGPEFTYIAFDELTQFAEDQYVYLFSRLRRRTSITAPVRIRAASNPGGIGHAWVKERFPIDVGKTPDECGGKIFIPARVSDNPGLDPDEYARSLGELDDVLRAQLLDGNWGVFQGAAFTIKAEHLVDDFKLEDSHERFEALDYGLNGTPWSLIPVDYEGNLVFWDMVYVKELLPSDVTKLVIDKRKEAWGFDNQAWADPSIWHRTGLKNKWGAPAMLADEFSDHGVPLIAANNDPRAGLIRIRELLALDEGHQFPSWHPRAGEYGAPRMFIHKTRCARLVDELRAAPLQPIDKPGAGEKVDPAWESVYGHACAMARYAVMTRPDPSVRPKPVPESEKARIMQELRRRRDRPELDRQYAI